jgi:hypothetical protein
VGLFSIRRHPLGRTARQQRRTIYRRRSVWKWSLEIIGQAPPKPPLEFHAFKDMEALSAINDQPGPLSPSPKLELNIFVAPC